MKKYLLFFFLFPVFCVAQVHFSPGISIISEYSINQFDAAGMNGFVNSFNTFWGNRLERPYQEFSGKEFSHLNFGLGFRIISTGKIGYTASSSFLYGRKKYIHDPVIWDGGVENELNFRVRDLQWTFTNGIHIKNLIYLESYVDANFRRIRLKHYTVYQDGSKSLSSEYKINGLYTGTVASFDVGFQVGVRVKSFLLYLKPSWALKNFPPAKGLVSLSDYDSNNFPPTDFPSDYIIYGTDPIQFVQNDLGVKTDDFEGFRLAIGLEYILGAENNY